MTLYELNEIIEQLERLKDTELAEFYRKKREQLKADIQTEIRGLLNP